MYKVYVKTDEHSRVTAVNSSAFIPEDDLENWVEIDSGSGDKYHHAQGNYFAQPIMAERGVYRYKLVSGKAVERTTAEIQADIDAIPPPPPDPPVVTQKAATVMFRALAQTDVITPADALDNSGMFPMWDDCIGQRAEAGSYWRHGDKLYRVNAGQGHTIQADWAPDYKKGDKVTHGGKRWISTADANTWVPGAYGWEESK